MGLTHNMSDSDIKPYVEEDIDDKFMQEMKDRSQAISETKKKTDGMKSKWRRKVFNEYWFEDGRHNDEGKKYSNYKLSDKKIALKLVETFGDISRTAKILGVGLSTVKDRIKKSERLSAIYKMVTEELLDVAESVIISKVVSGDVDMAKYYLNSKGQSRGYGKGNDKISGGGGNQQQISFNITVVKDSKHAEKIDIIDVTPEQDLIDYDGDDDDDDGEQ